MWQYAVCRTVAEKLGYEWGIDPSPTHDYFNGQNQMYFMSVDFGCPVSGIVNNFYERWTKIRHIVDVNITMLDSSIYDIPDNTILMGDNGAFGGLFQSEDYIIDRKPDIQRWFHIISEYEYQYNKKLHELGFHLDNDLCVINFRGGEYRGLSEVLLRQIYWKNCMDHMLQLNPDMKFLAITDDVELCSQCLPYQCPVIHIDVGFDFYVVNQAKWLIISNSSFGWWAAWLNTKCNKILAPKYWARHNVSDGYWATGDVYTRDFIYMDREGKLSDYETCKNEAQEYYKSKNII